MHSSSNLKLKKMNDLCTIGDIDETDRYGNKKDIYSSFSDRDRALQSDQGDLV